MSFQDFAQLTPEEFNSAYEAWLDEHNASARGEWERCRWICYFILKPYAKKSLRPTDIFKFEWDKPKGRGKMTKQEREAERKEFERLKELWKDE